MDYTTEGLQAIADAQNIAFADRNKYMGDSDFIDLPLPPFTPMDGGLLSKRYAAQRCQRPLVSAVSLGCAVTPTPLCCSWEELRGGTQREVAWGVPP